MRYLDNCNNKKDIILSDDLNIINAVHIQRLQSNLNQNLENVKNLTEFDYTNKINNSEDYKKINLAHEKSLEENIKTINNILTKDKFNIQKIFESSDYTFAFIIIISISLLIITLLINIL
jgi:hypothetical protein